MTLNVVGFDLKHVLFVVQLSVLRVQQIELLLEFSDPLLKDISLVIIGLGDDSLREWHSLVLHGLLVESLLLLLLLHLQVFLSVPLSFHLLLLQEIVTTSGVEQVAVTVQHALVDGR